jgi:hypothetical protein
MSSFADRLPNRFPVGTRYVIEGCGGGEGRLRIYSGYLESPDGRPWRLYRPATPPSSYVL